MSAEQSVAEISKGLSDGERAIVMNTNPLILPTDWRVICPNDNAFQKATKKGLIRIGPDDIGWVATPLHAAVRDYLTHREQEG